MDLQPYFEINLQIAKLVPLWTQGAGSNISCKVDSKKLIIKASGFRLDQVNTTHITHNGFVYLDYLKLRSLLKKTSDLPNQEHEINYSLAIMESKDSLSLEQLRPSMEAGFHALSPFKWVMHFHSLPSILMAEIYLKDQDMFKEWLSKNKLENKINFIPLSKPGWELTQHFKDSKHSINIIANHGVILQSNSEDILSEWNHIEDLFLTDFSYTKIKLLKNDLLQAASNHQNIGISLATDQITKLSAYKMGPLKFYFPDMAIYYPKMAPYLNKEAQNLTISSNASKDLVEIWQATQILYEAMPELTEIPETMIQEITQLPTEKLRQNYIR